MSRAEKRIACLRRMHVRLDTQIRGAEAIGQPYRGIDYHREERGALAWALAELADIDWDFYESGNEDGAAPDAAEEGNDATKEVRAGDPGPDRPEPARDRALPARPRRG